MLRRFFIFCSGAASDIIAECPESEKNKFASIGATVFLTALLAFVSGGYALYTIFLGEKYAFSSAIIFGLIWACVIFNLDRYIVSSLRKEGNLKRELGYAAPRFILAFFISLVIAKPLEVRIFASRIGRQVLEDKRKKMFEDKKMVDSLNDLTKLGKQANAQNEKIGSLDSLQGTDPRTAEFVSLTAERNSAVTELDNTRKSNEPRIEGINEKIHSIYNDPDHFSQDSSGRPIQLKPAYRKEAENLVASRNVLITAIKDKRFRVSNLDSAVSGQRKEYRDHISEQLSDTHTELSITNLARLRADSIAGTQLNESDSINKVSYTNNFITQVEALGNLREGDSSSLWWTGTLLMLLFICIEIAPVLVKLLSKRGPYDEMLDRVEYAFFLTQQQFISDMNDEVNHSIKASQATNQMQGEFRLKIEKEKLERELSGNESLLEDIADKQSSLAKMMVDKWYGEEMKKI